MNNNIEQVVETQSLQPTPNSQRTLGNIAYVMSWIGAVININSFMMGAALVPPNGVLNLIQALIAMTVGVTIMAVFMNLNGDAGYKYGIPFVVHARPSFGLKGTLLPGLIRAIPCIFWYGIQTWIGAGAINTVAKVIFGFDNIMICFISFLILQIALSALGFEGIKWIETFGTAFIIFALSVMFYIIYTNFSSEVINNLVVYQGDWGWPVVFGIATFGGTYATYIVTMGDIIRELRLGVKSKAKLFAFHWLGTLPFTMFMAIIGLMSSSVTGNWSPIDVIAEIMPNKALLIMTLLFIAVAQVTTNLLINVVPASYVVMQYTPIKKYETACIAIGVLAGVSMPWKLTTSTGFVFFVQVLSAFLVPTAVVMMVDYYVFRNKTYNLDDLYNEDGHFAGFNWNGIIAVIVGAVFALVFIDVSWLASLVPTALTYYALMKYGNLSNEFKAGTNLEK